MPTIAVVGNKGGAGKTTLSVNVASALNLRDSTVVLDADPQRSVLQWRAMRDTASTLGVLDAVDGVEQAVEGNRSAFSHLVVDCPPSVEAPQTRAALRLVDNGSAHYVAEGADVGQREGAVLRHGHGQRALGHAAGAAARDVDRVGDGDA